MLYLVGLGLGDATDITVKGLQAVRGCSRVYLEAYTSILTVGKEALVSPRLRSPLPQTHPDTAAPNSGTQSCPFNVASVFRKHHYRSYTFISAYISPAQRVRQVRRHLDVPVAPQGSRRRARPDR